MIEHLLQREFGTTFYSATERADERLVAW